MKDKDAEKTMLVKRIGKKALFYWRLRLTLYFLIPAFLSGVFIGFYRHWIWQLATGLWLVIYLLFFLVYYTLKWRRLYYRLDNEKISVYGGVVYWRIRSIPLKNIQTVQLISSPLLHLFSLRTMVIYGAGISIRLPCLRKIDAYKLYTRLTGDRLDAEAVIEELGG